MTVILNTPNCPVCTGNTVQSAGLAPFYQVDPGKLTLLNGIPQTVVFKNIKATSASQWAMPKSECLNAAKEGVSFDIPLKTGAGFTVVAYDDCTFEYFCIKI